MSWAGWVPQIDGWWAKLDADGNLIKRQRELPPKEELDLSDQEEFYPDDKGQ